MKRLSNISHFFQRIYLRGARLPEKSRPYFLPAGQRAGMRRYRPGARIGETALVNDYGLLTVDFRYHVAQEPSVLHAFQIHGNDLRVLIMGQIIQKIRAVERQGIAVTDGLAEMDAIPV
jgi:hypothetical protein